MRRGLGDRRRGERGGRRSPRSLPRSPPRSRSRPESKRQEAEGGVRAHYKNGQQVNDGKDVVTDILPRSSRGHRDQYACYASHGTHPQSRGGPRTQQRRSCRVLAHVVLIMLSTQGRYLQTTGGRPWGRDITTDESAVAVSHVSALSNHSINDTSLFSLAHASQGILVVCLRAISEAMGCR